MSHSYHSQLPICRKGMSSFGIRGVAPEVLVAERVGGYVGEIEYCFIHYHVKGKDAPPAFLGYGSSLYQKQGVRHDVLGNPKVAYCAIIYSWPSQR
jgi:hypothetical protein